ncbi:MAG: hypothetical protein ACRDDY_03710 [Clostridium sp.]|uniref:hypothetical protein n=1 Tax=Clostridium sp. TaxID=1506 RepID=UPI003EE5BC6E
MLTKLYDMRFNVENRLIILRDMTFFQIKEEFESTDEYYEELGYLRGKINILNIVINMLENDLDDKYTKQMEFQGKLLNSIIGKL